MERSRVGHFPPRRRRSVVRATVWPWQTGPTVPQGPPATRNSVENRTSPTKKRLVSSLPSSSATAISTSLAPLSGSSEGAFVVGNERDNGACDFVESRTGALVEDVNTPESGVGGGGRNISGPIGIERRSDMYWYVLEFIQGSTGISISNCSAGCRPTKTGGCF